VTNSWGQIWWGDVEYIARDKAWQKLGYKNFEEVKEATRNLKSEKKLELLCQVFEDEIAKKYLSNKTEFMEKLGKQTYVSREEMLEYTEKTYPNYKVDTMWYDDHRINPETLQFERMQKKK